ncbi:SDR family NAD(P)-dependent oxidoreductase [Sporosarcina sp. OR05]|uniref:SDR family NAD(P)-dependent oxidoreductase n=1 Tax=Sporosarcina sp. OR05 TaxID=2969819 RepID=UPI00352A9C99
MDIYIVTGASKGLGFELCQQLTERGHEVIGVARTKTSGIKQFIEADLSQTDNLEDTIHRIIEEYEQKATSFTLINNAGTVEPIGLIGTVTARQMEQAIALNLTAPMVLSNAFISKLKSFRGQKRIVSISSGAGRNAYEGWGVYCTTKAGLDHFTRVAAIEQQSATYPVDVMSIAPGIIDTGMQETIRSSDASDFPLLDRFVDYKEQGKLSSAEEVAGKLIALLDRKDFRSFCPIADIREI